MKILIVEDQASDIFVPHLLAVQLGFKVDLAFDGKQALHIAAKNPADLIILDWNMPIMSGADFLYEIEYGQTEQGLSKQNVILHTGEPLRFEDFAKVTKFNILDIWKKPMQPLDILKRIKIIQETKGKSL